MEGSTWRKSTRSNSQGACVEARAGESVVAVRDTQQAGAPGRVTIEFQASAWREFTVSLQRQ